ncbi:hypothetical protein KAR91_82455 [Candidatus Pacearchaeota archaeon]|nr:hypothetical protein [Candidatus Pacearchaeota archaeon]
MIKTKNFNPESDVKLLCTCGHPDCDKRSVSQEYLNRLQLAREIYNKPMSVTSGGRCSYHPNQANKADPNSGDHPEGNGADISANGATRGNIVQAGLEAGFNAIGVAKTFVHLGYRSELPKGHLTMWVY